MRSTFVVCALVLAGGCSEPDPETSSTSGNTGVWTTTGSSPSTGGATTSGGATTGADPNTSSTTGGSTGATGTQTTTAGGSTGTMGSGTGPSTSGGADAGTMTTGGGDTDAGQTGSPVDGGQPEPDSGGPEPQTCPAGAAGSPGRSDETVQVGGVSRDYILYVPDSYTGEQPVPLMVNFHPLLSNAGTAARSSGYQELADQEGFIVAFPDSLQDQAWNLGGVCCTRDPGVDDVGFARELVAQVQSNYCVDKKRIYASGFSMGGGMAHYLACEASDLFAAVATGHFDLFEENTCAPTRPLTVFSIRSPSDFIVPYEGGPKSSAPNGFQGSHTFLGAEGTFERWAEINGCSGQPVDTGGDCQTYQECSEGVEVTLCTVGGGHSFPDAELSWEGISGFSLP